MIYQKRLFSLLLIVVIAAVVPLVYASNETPAPPVNQTLAMPYNAGQRNTDGSTLDIGTATNTNQVVLFASTLACKNLDNLTDRFYLQFDIKPYVVGDPLNGQNVRTVQVMDVSGPINTCGNPGSISITINNRLHNTSYRWRVRERVEHYNCTPGTTGCTPSSTENSTWRQFNGSKLAFYGYNRAPVANGDSYTTAYATPLVTGGAIPSLFANDSDPDGDTFQVSPLPTTTTQGGILSINASTGHFTYTPPPNFSGMDSFTYQIKDLTTSSAAATVTITVTPGTDTDQDGVPDAQDLCPATPIGVTVDVTGCPLDTDIDGVFDGIDQCPATPVGAIVDITGCPSDEDSDGVFNGIDQCAATPVGATVDANGCPFDSDGDSILDGLDHCPATPVGAIIDANGCPSDEDSDGVFDGIDQCPATPVGATVDANGCPFDSDGDNILDGLDQCPATPVGATIDANGCPSDADNDGVFNGIDQCPATPVGATVDTAGCPSDGDSDGVLDGLDLCPNSPVGATVDANGCTNDSDGDGVLDGIDQCPATPFGATVDTAGCPSDGDSDGVLNGLDHCPATPVGATVDANGCTNDSDADSVLDGIDQCPATPVGATVDANGCPSDSDGDGVPDGIDQCPSTLEGTEINEEGCPAITSQGDIDNDGIIDIIDACPLVPGPASNNGCPVVTPPTPRPVVLVPGCDAQIVMPDGARMGQFITDALVYWDPDSSSFTDIYLAAGKTAWVFGVDASGQYYQILWQCDTLWVPVSTMSPAVDGGNWNGLPLPTDVIG